MAAQEQTEKTGIHMVLVVTVVVAVVVLVPQGL